MYGYGKDYESIAFMQKGDGMHATEWEDGGRWSEDAWRHEWEIRRDFMWNRCMDHVGEHAETEDDSTRSLPVFTRMNFDFLKTKRNTCDVEGSAAMTQSSRA